MTGTVRRLMTNGYGFIRPDNARKDSVFFHVTSLRHDLSFEDLRPGTRVEFETGIDLRSDRKLAVAVRLLEDAPPLR